MTRSDLRRRPALIAGAAPTAAALNRLMQTSDASPETGGSHGARPSVALVTPYAVALLAIATRRLHDRDA